MIFITNKETVKYEGLDMSRPEAEDVLHCQGHCGTPEDCRSKESFITFEEGNLKDQVSKLKSSVARKLMQDTFADLFAGVKSMQSAGNAY